MSGKRSFLPYPAEQAGGAPDAGASSSAAAGNYVAIDRGTPTAPTTASAGAILAAIVLTPDVSGILRVNANQSITDATSEPVTLSLYAAEQAVAGVPITLTGGVAAAQFGSTAAADSLGETSTTGAGIVVVGAGAPVLLAAKSAQTGGAEPIELVVSGLFSFSTGGTTKTPFVLGETCVLYLVVTATTGALSAPHCEFAVQENGAL